MKMETTKKKVAAQAIIFNRESGQIDIQSVIDATADMIETKNGVYHIDEQVKTYVDVQNQKLVYVFDADIPARVEAENLKMLRRSVTLKRLFDFERTPGGLDFMKLLPYIIILALILFK